MVLSPHGLPRIRGTQIGLSDADSVDQIKRDMQQGSFAYPEQRARIAGVRDLSGTYHVKVGHHRMAAAMEIYRETGEAAAILELLRCGRWDDVQRAPIDSRPLPARHWWGKLRNWINL